MPPVALGLILISCVMHAGWNLLLKRASDKMAFTAIFLAAVPILYLPIIIALLPGAAVPAAGWLCVLVTGFAYAGYFIGLAEAYRRGDLSVTYPLVRGLGPILALIGAVLLLGERPSLGGLLGVGLILSGSWLAQAGGIEPGGHRSALRGAAPAVFVAAMVAVYSIVDKTAIATVHVPPIVYLYLTYTLAAILVMAWAVARIGSSALRREWSAGGKSAVAVGALNPLTYLLVLYAMRIPRTPVSYVTPLRSASVLVAVLLGVGVLREERPAAKISAAILNMAGVALIAIRW